MPEIPKSFSQTEIDVGWPRSLFLFSVILAFTLQAFSWGLSAYEASISRKNSQIDKEIQDAAASVTASDMQKILTLDTQLTHLKELLPQHLYTSRLLDLIEPATHPQVRLTDFKFDYSQKKVDIGGTAPSAELISQQAAAYTALNGVASFVIKDTNRDINSVKFNFSFHFKPQALFP